MDIAHSLLDRSIHWRTIVGKYLSVIINRFWSLVTSADEIHNCVSFYLLIFLFFYFFIFFLLSSSMSSSRRTTIPPPDHPPPPSISLYHSSPSVSSTSFSNSGNYPHQHRPPTHQRWPSMSQSHHRATNTSPSSHHHHHYHVIYRWQILSQYDQPQKYTKIMVRCINENWASISEPKFLFLWIKVNLNKYNKSGNKYFKLVK